MEPRDYQTIHFLGITLGCLAGVGYIQSSMGGIPLSIVVTLAGIAVAFIVAGEIE